MFTRGIDKRIKIILLIFSSILLIIVLRVFYVQVVDYKKLSTLASDLWSRNLPIEVSRGRILDRNGVVLAVVMDLKIGEVLAMSSRPNFNHNNYQGIYLFGLVMNQDLLKK